MDQIRTLFKNRGIKATAQRIIVYRAMSQVGHAPVDEVVTHVHRFMPTIAVASVYNILESLSQSGLITKLFTDDNKLYYDITSTPHYHLFGRNNNRIEDYVDPELTTLITEHLSSKQIKNFTAEDIKIQIIGTFKE